MKKEKRYTRKDLEIVVKAYEKNFDKLMAAVGTPMHKHYLKEEARLNHLSKLMLEDIGPVDTLKNKDKK